MRRRGDSDNDATSIFTAVSYGILLLSERDWRWPWPMRPDIISVEGNPIEQIANIRRVRFIMRDGVRYDWLSWR